MEETWRVVQTRDGVVLVPRRQRGEVKGVEIVRDQVFVDGQPVTGAELRSRLGADAEAVLSLSYLDPVARRALFEPIERPVARSTSSSLGQAEPEPSARVIMRRHGARVRIGSDLVVGEQERVEDAAVAILGSVNVDGEVGGDVVAVGGGVRLGPRAVVRGAVTAVGGRIEADPRARVLGGANEVALMWPERWESWPGHPGWRLRPDAHWWASTGFAVTSVRLAIAGLLGLVAALIGGSWYRRVSHQVTTSPWQAVVIGIAAQVVFGPMLVVLCGALLFSIIGIPVLALVPLALVLLAFAWVFGFAAVAERVGQRMLGFGRGTAPAALAFLVGFVLLTALVWLARFTWWAGWLGAGAALTLGVAGALVEGIAWSAGLGAVILGWLRRSQVATSVQPPPLVKPGEVSG